MQGQTKTCWLTYFKTHRSPSRSLTFHSKAHKIVTVIATFHLELDFWQSKRFLILILIEAPLSTWFTMAFPQGGCKCLSKLEKINSTCLPVFATEQPQSSSIWWVNYILKTSGKHFQLNGSFEGVTLNKQRLELPAQWPTTKGKQDSLIVCSKNKTLTFIP